jgi:M3 family oligoendopeptidase
MYILLVIFSNSQQQQGRYTVNDDNINTESQTSEGESQQPPSSLSFDEIPYERLTIGKAQSTIDWLLWVFGMTTNAEEQAEKIRVWNEINKEWESHGTLARIRYSQNTQNEEYQKENEYWDELSPQLDDLNQQFIELLLNSAYRSELEEIFSKQVFDLWTLRNTSFSSKIIEHKQKESKLSSEYSKRISGLKIDFLGEEHRLSSLFAFYGKKERQTRFLARKAQDELLSQEKEHFDRIFDEMVQIRHEMAHILGFPSYTEMAYAEMQRTDYGPDEVVVFRNEVQKHLVPVCSQIYQNRARDFALLTEERNDFGFQDEILTSVSGNPTPKGDHDWMLDRAQEMFSEMGDDFGTFFTTLKNQKLMDLDSREGKSGGGYCTLFTKYGLPFIFANFNGSDGDVRVFTHECGHAFQAYTSRNLPLRDVIWPTSEAAEIHSMSLEFLTYPYMKYFFEDETSLFFQKHLEGALLFIPYGCAVDEFQHWIYANPNATPDERAQLWLDLEQKYLPHRKYTTSQGVLPYFESGRFWQRQRHIFFRPFYYIDYCLAQVCALQFWHKAELDRDVALRDYRHLCSLGGTLPFTKLVQEANLINPFTEGVLGDVLSTVQKYLQK